MKRVELGNTKGLARLFLIAVIIASSAGCADFTKYDLLK